MKSKSRSENASLNAIWAIISQILITVMGLFSRKVFLNYLGEELLGVNSLFSDVLMLFSFADLGFGTAIMFSMYKPIAENDESKIQSLLLFYRKIYRIVVGALILVSFVFGLFLGFIKTGIPLSELRLYYVLYQISNIIEYIWAYRENYVIAVQHERELLIFNLIYTMGKYIAQVSLLFVYSNFFWFLIVGIVCTLIKKIAVNYYIIRKYPITILRKDTSELDLSEKNEIKRKSFAVLIIRVGNLLINQTDSMIVSYAIHVSQWGLASNYLLIKRSIFTVTNKIYSAVLPSMGNLAAQENPQREFSIFMEYDFLNAWLHTFCFIALTVLSSSFIALFFGDRVVLPFDFVFVFYFASFIDGLRSPVSLIREAKGIYEKDKWYTILAAVVNLATSIPLALILGLTGVYVGTILAMIVLHVSRTIVLFRTLNIEYTSKDYFMVLLKHVIFALILFTITYFIICAISGLISNKYVCFVIDTFIVLAIPNLIWIISHYRSKEFNSIITKVRNRFKLNY